VQLVHVQPIESWCSSRAPSTTSFATAVACAWHMDGRCTKSNHSSQLNFNEVHFFTKIDRGARALCSTMAPTAYAMASAPHHALFLVAVACAAVGEGLGLEGVDASGGECDHAAKLVARSFKCTSLTRSHHAVKERSSQCRVVAWGGCAPTATTVATVATDTANRILYCCT
jgi:hypothetical protein